MDRKIGFYLGAQNDQTYIIYGEPPALSNDYPRHDAEREPVAKVLNQELAEKLISSIVALEGNGWVSVDEPPEDYEDKIFWVVSGEWSDPRLATYQKYSEGKWGFYEYRVGGIGDFIESPVVYQELPLPSPPQSDKEEG